MTGRYTKSLCLFAGLAAMLAVSGCDWKGEGKTVASALVATKAVKTRAFVGSMKLDMAGVQALQGDAAKKQSMTMTFSGVSDASDPAKPKMIWRMSAEGVSTEVMAPGDGRVYVTAGGRSWYAEVPPEQASQQAIDPRRIYAALGDAVGNFKKAPPMTNSKGAPVTTVSSTISKSKLCGEVLDAFGDALEKTSGLGQQFGATASATPKLDAGGDKMLKGFCKTMLKSDPRVWFGIDGGKLTDVALTASLTVPLAGTMNIEVQYHEYDQDKPQGGFTPPAGAQPLDSLTQLPTGIAGG